MEENTNKLHFKCIDFNFSMRVTVYADVFMCFYQNLFSSLNTTLTVDKHCSDVSVSYTHLTLPTKRIV